MSIGEPVPRIDGKAKVTGEASYAADFPQENVAHAYLVTSAVACGVLRSVDVTEAKAVPGVLAILTYENTHGRVKALKSFAQMGFGSTTLVPLDTREIKHADQIVAMVVAETFEAAREAAFRVGVDIEARTPSASLDSPGAEEKDAAGKFTKGDAGKAFDASAFQVNATYTTPPHHHNPMELFVTVCAWEGDRLTVWEPSQYVHGTRAAVAKQLHISRDDVRVITPFIGGAFGSKGMVTPRTALVALAAKDLGRPVKLVATRQQGFTVSTYRAETQNDLKLGADREGNFTSLVLETKELASRMDAYASGLTESPAHLYAFANVATKQTLVHADRSTPGFMRAPAEMPSIFALESAIDELASEMKIDPVELRRRNDAKHEPIKGLPWTSRSLMECYDAAAKAFGWKDRKAKMTDGDWLVGWGCATALYPVYIGPAAVEVTLNERSAVVRTAAHEIGTGVMTVIAQTAAEKLGLPISAVEVVVGDSDLPPSPVAGGSNSTASICNAVAVACDLVLAKKTRPAQALAKTSPPGVPPFGIGNWLEEHGVPIIAPQMQNKKHVSASFGAEFVEVRVHRRTREIRVPRIVGAFAAGRIMNARTAKSQLMGGMIWGISSALFEGTEVDPRTARYVGNDLAEYLIPVMADVPSVETILVDETDTEVNPLGIKGIGELGIVGTAAAVANAVFHATGRRIRDLPIRLEDLL